MADHLDIDKLKQDPHNANLGSDRGRDLVAQSLKDLGAGRSLLLDKNGVLIAGNKTQAQAKALGFDKVRVIQTDGSELIAVQRTDLDINDQKDDKARRLAYADNRASQLGMVWDPDQLAKDAAAGIDLLSVGFNADDLKAIAGSVSAGGGAGGAAAGDSKTLGSLAKDFTAPPFSVLDARAGYWLERKQQWLDRGLDGAAGRGDVQASLGNAASRKADYDGADGAGDWAATSVFDPVLAEILCSWFCPKGGLVIDPFAGGITRGAVAAHYGLDYIGLDVRRQQVDANRDQVTALDLDPAPVYIHGDSRDIKAKVGDARADLILTCPPYADLERYSDQDDDLSTLDYDDFLAAYRSIIMACADLLRVDRFAAIVVGDVRDKAGHYRNFVGDTVTAFLDAGLQLYNDAVLITMLGTAPMRARKTFVTRKLVKCHQNVLVFVKGDAKAAAAKCPDISQHDLADQFGDVL